MLAAGTLLSGRYRLLRLLGEGGSALTWAAHDALAGEEVALKLLRDEPASLGLRAEFARLRELSHPHLTRVREFGRAFVPGVPRAERVSFYTSDLIVGGTLREHAARHGFDACVPALRDALLALSFLHRVGLRHGDVKPENVLVNQAGRGVLIDLGCAQPVGSRVLLGGTPGYFAPELLRGESADQRADLFALGVMLRELGAAGELARLAERLSQPEAKARPSSLAAAMSECGLDWDFEVAPLGRASSLRGRSQALEDARAALANVVQAGEGPRIVWVEGPRGVGSTRFVRELCFQCDEALELFEASAQGASVRALLGRALGAIPGGVEALVAGVAQHARSAPPTLLVVHDLDRGTAEHTLELALALGASAGLGRLAWVVSSTRAPPAELDAASVLRVVLEPLTLSDVRAWAGPLLPATQCDALHAYTGGFPAQIERALAALASGAQANELLSSVASAAGAEQRQLLAALLSDLDARERTALVCAALALPAAGDASPRLFERGLLQRSGGELRLAREGDASALFALLPRVLVQQWSLRAAEACASDASELGCARRIAHLTRAGEIQEALSLLRDQLETARRAPRLFAQHVRELLPHMAPADLVLSASLLRASGEPQRALVLLARARRRAEPAVLDALWLEAAEAYLALGRFARAERALGRVRDRANVECAECLLRVRVRLGDHAGAWALGEQALARCTLPGLRARLHEGLALAASYLGEHAQAEAELAAAEQAESEPAPRVEARRLALRGFFAMRRDEPERALPAYERALARADAHGLADLVANALVNLAGIRQMLGAYGSARELYERALRMARALGRRQSELLLRANLANVALEAGAFEEAARALDALAADPQAQPIAAAVRRYRAELLLLTGQAHEALAVLSAAGSAPADERELHGAEVLRMEAQLVLGELEVARTLRERLAAAAPRFEPDLVVRYTLVAGRLARAEHDDQAALASFERALSAARATGLLPMIARVELALAELYAASGSSNLEREHRARADARWERMALDLPAAARDAFWAHPLRRRSQSAAERVAPSQQSLTFVRVVELSRRINAQRTIDDVLSFALDAALELTSAERGFVLLRDAESGGFSVKSQRQLDADSGASAPLAWSRSIAERVIATGEAVITLDAAHDPRFQAQASVHAMGLKSVLCVPFRGTRELKGALYLDNRFLRSRFTETDAALVQAFAEQVAVALGNAQLLRELEHKQRELVKKQRKVEELLRGKEREIELMSSALAEERAARGTRFAYAEMIGNSASLRRLFATLDRVIPTDLPVIVRGESGTGKELVARAIHGQGPRASKPFVSLNCAALPENLLESELFGYVRGAFTGADRDKPGLFVAAHGGTLFLDELGELPLSLQVKLLRVLTEQTVRPLGATRSQPVDVRIVAATHRDLARMRDEGLFREDLYYRLSVVELVLPPLRERAEDIIPIADRLLSRRAEQQGDRPKRLSHEAAQALLGYPFPGNVRELENVLLRASALCEAELIRPADLGLPAPAVSAQKRAARTRADFERGETERLLEALKRERWNISAVSRSLAIPRNTLYRKLARLGLLVPPQS
jgi:transcriptional regulator with GAF, ATPase, and Fis domain